MFPAKLNVPKIEINFDTPNRDHFLRDDFPRRHGYTVLGRGSYGVVIKARYKGKSVAVKIVETHRKHRSRYDSLRNESNILNLKHENIVRVLKIISGAQYGLVIMERFDGQCLQNILNQNHAITVYHRLLILCDIINGLCFCHRHHIVHLDVKPQNVIVCLLIPGCQSDIQQCAHVRNYICKLCDFGSSIVLNTLTLNDKSSNRGTIRYMAPELLRGAGGISEPADIYSFGISMWQLSEGKDPYNTIASNEAVAYNVVKKKLRPDSVTTVEILRSESFMVSPSRSVLVQQSRFRARKNSDNSLEIPQSYFKASGNSHTSFHSSILVSSNASGQKPNVEYAAAAMSDVLKQQGIDLVELSMATSGGGHEYDADDSAQTALDMLFVQTFDVDPVNQNHIRQEYRALYRKCWQHEAALRPTAIDVRAAVHCMMKRIVCCK